MIQVDQVWGELQSKFDLFYTISRFYVSFFESSFYWKSSEIMTFKIFIQFYLFDLFLWRFLSKKKPLWNQWNDFLKDWNNFPGKCILVDRIEDFWKTFFCKFDVYIFISSFKMQAQSLDWPIWFLMSWRMRLECFNVQTFNFKPMNKDEEILCIRWKLEEDHIAL